MAKCMICGKVEPVMRCICGDCLPAPRKRGKLPKKELDAMIEAERRYWEDISLLYDAETREVRLAEWTAAKDAMDAQVPGMGYSLQLLLGGILGVWPLAKDATNQEIYTILGLLGWEIYEEAEPDGTAL